MGVEGGTKTGRQQVGQKNQGHTHSHTDTHKPFMGTVLKEVLLSQDVCINGCIWVFLVGFLFDRQPVRAAVRREAAAVSDSDSFGSKPQAR